MSPLWRDQLHIFISPRQVSLTRWRRGGSPRIDVQHTLPCAATQSGHAPWQAALATLTGALPELAMRRGDVEVVLSNHFVRYTLVADSEQISSAAEEQAWVRHHFTRTYGGDAQHWTLRLSDNGVDTGPRLASAVDTALLENLGALFRPGTLSLRSVQPYLMAAFNNWRLKLAGNTWFALIEPGRLCLAQLKDNQWHALKTIKVGDAWLPELLALLNRTKLLSGAEPAAAEPVYVFAPGCGEIDAAEAQQHALQLLSPAGLHNTRHNAPRPLALDVTA